MTAKNERSRAKLKKVLKAKGYSKGELPKGKKTHHVKSVAEGGKTTKKNIRVVSKEKHKKIHKNRRIKRQSIIMLSKFVEKLRKKHGFTKEYLASVLDISRPTYTHFEQGTRDLTITQAEKLAETFNLSRDNFLNEIDTELSVKILKKTKTSSKKNEIRIEIPQEKVDKFKQVLLYILKKVGGKPNVGMTVLYKLLYFIDFDYYEKYEEQLMGLKYIKNHYGPTPIIFEKVIKNMISENMVECIKSKYYKHPQKKYLINPSIELNLGILNGQEKEHIDYELKRLSDFNANKLSDLSHKDVPWISAEEGKPLDYESVFYRTEETTVRNYPDDTEA